MSSKFFYCKLSFNTLKGFVVRMNALLPIRKQKALQNLIFMFRLHVFNYVNIYIFSLLHEVTAVKSFMPKFVTMLSC